MPGVLAYTILASCYAARFAAEVEDYPRG